MDPFEAIKSATSIEKKAFDSLLGHIVKTDYLKLINQGENEIEFKLAFSRFLLTTELNYKTGVLYFNTSKIERDPNSYINFIHIPIPELQIQCWNRRMQFVNDREDEFGTTFKRIDSLEDEYTQQIIVYLQNQNSPQTLANQ